MIQTITFSPLDSEKSITFNIIDDLLALEPLERFMLDLAVATISDRILLQPYNRTNISIIDDNGMFSLHLNTKNLNLVSPLKNVNQCELGPVRFVKVGLNE